MLAKSTVKLEAILLTVNLIRSPIKVELVEGRWNIFCYTDGLSPYRVEVWQDNKLKHSMEQKEGLATECRMSFPADFEDDTCCLRLCILLRSAQDQNPIIAEGRMVAGIQATNLIIHKGREKGTHEAKIEQQRLLLPGYEMDLFEIFGQPHSIINVEQKAEGSSSLGSQAYFSASNSDLPGFNRECVICLSQRRDTLFLPCRHMCLCLPCAESLCHQSDKCPICRQGTTQKNQLVKVCLRYLCFFFVEFRSMLNINSL